MRHRVQKAGRCELSRSTPRMVVVELRHGSVSSSGRIVCDAVLWLVPNCVVLKQLFKVAPLPTPVAPRTQMVGIVSTSILI